MNHGPKETTLFAAAFSASEVDLDGLEIVVAPPLVSLAAAQEGFAETPVAVAAQNCHFEAGGAFTGETSIAMLEEMGVEFVIVGHSERRALFGEDDAFINRKVLALLAANLQPILCIGETLEQRDSGELEQVLRGQLESGLAGVSAKEVSQVVLAYEPVWAIGTGRTASPAQAQEAHAFIRSVLVNLYDQAAAERVRIQYGGSVKPDNAAELLGQPDIDGALIGGASLKAADFAAICRAAKG